jgi:glyoxylase-like metal-dependent hydrolase (beta-lactamase superfamily II)
LAPGNRSRGYSKAPADQHLFFRCSLVQNPGEAVLKTHRAKRAPALRGVRDRERKGQVCMRSMVALVFSICALSLVPVASSQATGAPGGEHIVASDAGARMEELAPGVYAIIHADATDQWPHGNTGVIVGRSSIFVIDSTYLPSRARADIALIRRISPKPVRYLVTTHWHMDHNNGAIAYLEAFPQLTYLVERNTARWMVLNQHYWSRLSTAQDSARRAALGTLEQELARGTDEHGAAFTEEERTQRQIVIAQRRNELEEFTSLQVITPNQLFDGVLNFDFEGRRIEIHNWGRANSPSDTTYYLPREQILFTGDILVQSPLPFVGASYPTAWSRVLTQLEHYRVRAIVPGHGPVLPDNSYLRQVHAYLDAAVSRVTAMIENGRTITQIKAELNLNDVRASVPTWNSASVTQDDWDTDRTTIASRAFHEIRGNEYSDPP